MRILGLSLTFLFIMWCATLHAEEYATDREVLEYVASVPRDIENNFGQLARYLAEPYDNEYDQAKSIAYWIASHVVYDGYVLERKNNDYSEVTEIGRNYRYQKEGDLVKSRVGICADYATLFMKMAAAAGIKAKVISGKVYRSEKEHDRIPKEYDLGHAWNSFKYRGKDIYVDVTWMANGAKMEVDKRLSEYEHRRSLRKIKSDNREDSRIHQINPYYFDFTYDKNNKDFHPKNEWIDKGIIRIEK